MDASAVVAVLVDDGPEGEWATELLRGRALAAPHHMPVEASSVLRRAALGGVIPQDVATLAHADLLSLRVELFPYAPLAERCWQLRANVTTHDAAYVALAEQLAAPLATLDVRLARATGPRCEFAVP